MSRPRLERGFMTIDPVKISTSIDRFFKSEKVTPEESAKLETIKAKFKDMNTSQVKKSVLSSKYWQVRSGIRELSKFTDEFIKLHPKFMDEKKAVEFSSVMRSTGMRPAEHIASEVLSRMKIDDGPKHAKAVTLIDRAIQSEQKKIQKANEFTGIKLKSVLRHMVRVIGPVGVAGGVTGLIVLGVISPPALIIASTVVAVGLAVAAAVTYFSFRLENQLKVRQSAMSNIAVYERYKEVIKRPEFLKWLELNKTKFRDFKGNDFRQ